jgi:hypothetical protein
MVALLAQAYMRRVRWEARVQAVQIGSVLAEMLGGGDGDGGGGQGEAGQRLTADAMLGMMGMRV